ncbi:MAG: flagellar filament capping protein FliD [Pigmentiphaga sp.]|uniref:flagellar filament capping protein FliD n=1 Tax=Pigmentiphaga sp. TaxID=1977564 RepID=UPI0029B8EA89|nr:flagellar filament capping protein FliD [Pigmentiphaga sp.]MDX3904133.1 flagellar filament capping protein FliD [Pigmentiphaga sp.]
MASIGSALGVGSGLDLTTLLSNLMAAESIPLTKLQSQEAGAQSKISAYGQLRSEIATLRDAVKNLAPAKFNGAGASSSATDIATATATNAAAKGTYSLEVLSLAKAEKAVSAALDDKSALVQPGQLTFTFGSVQGGVFVPGAGETKTVTIADGSNTLEGVRDAINEAEIGVSASLINDGSGTRLVLTALGTGAQQAFKITTTGSAGAGEPLSFLDYDPSTAPGYDAGTPAAPMSRLQAAADAQFKLDGLAISSAGNRVETAVDGVTLNLVKTGTSTITIRNDTSSGRAALQAVVDAYNKLLTTANTLAVNTPGATRGEAGSTGPLAGDSLVRDVLSRVRNEIFGPVNGATGPYTSLASIGVSFQADGTLKLDTARFDKAMASDADAIAGLFDPELYGEGRNIAERFAAQLDAVIDADGLIDARVDGLNASTKILQNQQEQLQNRLTQIEARYRAQFTALDSVLTQMNNTSSFLSQQLEALKNLGA